MVLEKEILNKFENLLQPEALEFLGKSVDAIVEAKQNGGKVVAVVGSGPNLHEGVTTLIATLIHRGVIDGVITSSAVICHEMGGTLDQVHRVQVSDLPDLGMPVAHDSVLEATLMPEGLLADIKKELDFNAEYYQTLLTAPGKDIIKAAANMAYPMGLRTENLAREALPLAVMAGEPLEKIVGLGADPLTMIGAGARKNVPVLVGIPQLIGGGAVGLSVGDSLNITARAARVARLLGSADVIIESAVALTQEIHDGPLETYTGHGIWSRWNGHWTYSLAEKTIVRIDLDPNLLLAWKKERQSGSVSRAISEGLPKTKLMAVPFRMEMSGFARLPGSLPVIADIGVVWPLMVSRVVEALGLEIDFYSYPQSTPEGQQMRQWIVNEVKPVSKAEMLSQVRKMEV